MSGDELLTRHGYLLIKLCMDGANIFTALEAISSTAIEHPEWDLEEQQTWDYWESQ